MHVYNEVLTVSAHKGTDICEFALFAQHGVIHKSICNIKMYICEHMFVFKEVLTVSTRKGTDICEFAQHGVIHKSTCNMKYVYL